MSVRHTVSVRPMYDTKLVSLGQLDAACLERLFNICRRQAVKIPHIVISSLKFFTARNGTMLISAFA